MSDQPVGRIETGTDVARIKRRARMKQMAEAGFNQTQTAEALGTSRTSVQRFAQSNSIVFAQRMARSGGEDVIREICDADDISINDPDNYREAIQDMKPGAAVDHLLGLLDGLTHQLPEMSLSPLPGLILTRLEARLLHHLNRHRNRPVATEALMFAMYQLRPDRDWPDTGIVGTRICNLRRKLRQAEISGVRIEACRAVGYCLQVNDGVRFDWQSAPSNGTRR
jgi:hypothetical protein